MFRRFIAPAAALAVLASAPVFAQPAPAPDTGYQSPAQSSSRGPAHDQRRIGARVQKLHDRLGITAAQQPQWDAVVAAMRDNAAAMRANPAVQAIRRGKLNAVQELNAAADVAHARADALQRMIPTVEALYASLSPEQQRTADQALDRMMHAGGHHRG